MTPIETPPSQPRSVTAAQVLLWLQLLTLICCGAAPVMMFWPAFMVMLNAGALRFLHSETVIWLIMALELLAAILYPIFTTRWLGAGDRRGRTAVSVGVVVLIAFAIGATVTMAQDSLGGARIWATFASAVPSIGFQVAAWICLYSRSAEQWFQARDEGPATLTDSDARLHWVTPPSEERPC